MSHAFLMQMMTERLRRTSENSLSSFIQAAWPLIEPKTPFVSGWHIDAISEHLEAVYSGEIKNLLINIPPRHAKSTIVSVGFPAWVWTKKAWAKFIFGSHSFSLSKRDSVKCRSLIQSEWFKNTFNINWHLRDDQNEKMKFDNTLGGSRLATSVTSSVIGFGSDFLILDDPHSPRSVRSEIQRETELNWIDQEFFTRINDPKTVAKIIIMQRLDERDASQHVLDKGDWEHLMLPAEFEPERKCVTSIGWEDPRTEPGEPLWPERFGVQELLDMKTGMGTRAAAGQLQQRPAPAEGNIVKREWWKFYREIPGNLEIYVQSWDLTFKDGKQNDFVVGQVWGRAGANKYLLDQVRGRMGFNEQIMAIQSLSAKWPETHAKYIEDAANAAAAVDILQNKISGIILVKPQGSKVVRAEAVSPQIESGNIYLPDPSIAPWIHDYIEEWAVFPGGKNDDQCDATTQCLLKLNEIVTLDWAPVSIKHKSKWK